MGKSALLTNILHNISDFCINIACNEGFGLATLESMQVGNPIIALKTGGLTRQVVDHRDGSSNGVALDPTVRNLVGSQMGPYIYEDHIDNQAVADAYMELYDLGPDGRKELGLKGFVAIKKGTPVYKKAREFYQK